MTKVTTYRELSQEMLLAEVLQVLATHSQTVNFLQTFFKITSHDCSFEIKMYRVPEPYCLCSHVFFKVTITGLPFFKGTNAKEIPGPGFFIHNPCLVAVA
jgi:hypothetical protein